MTVSPSNQSYSAQRYSVHSGTELFRGKENRQKPPSRVVVPVISRYSVSGQTTVESSTAQLSASLSTSTVSPSASLSTSTKYHEENRPESPSRVVVPVISRYSVPGQPTVESSTAQLSASLSTSTKHYRSPWISDEWSRSTPHPAPPGYTSRTLDTPGYTLLESLIAISIFLILMVPLTARLHEADKTARVRHKTTAMCILEQEAALIRHGESPFPVKKRTVAGREWVVETSAEGNPLRTYRMHAFLDGREISEVVFHNYEE